MADPQPIDPTTEIAVLMSPGHARAYQEWLQHNGLYLFKIPQSPEDSPYYTVGVSDRLYDSLPGAPDT
jgi:hypothetical protein